MRAAPSNNFHRTRTAVSPTAELCRRSVEVERASINEAERTVEIAFSSEAAVSRYYGTEILGHEKKNVRLSRLNNGGALLVEHDRRDQVGVVVRAWVDDDKRGRATVRFGKSARAEEIFQDVKDGIRRLVSVGYRIHKEEVTKGTGGVETVRATDWEPYELSLVSIPADDSVGVGRGMSDPPTNKNHNESRTDMSEQTPAATPAPIESARNAEPASPTPAPRVEIVREAPPVDPAAAARSAVELERRRVDAITIIAEQAQSQGIAVDARAALRDGHSPEQFRETAFQALVSRQQSYTPGVPSFSRSETRDISRFDLGTALRSLISGHALSGIERELVDEGFAEAQRCGLGRSAGIMLPSFLVQRDMTATGQTSVAGDQGGMTVPTNKAGLLDDFFNASIMRQLGATVLTGLTGNLDIPRLVAGTAAAGKAENGAADEVNPTTAQLALKPKRLPAFIDLSDQLLVQSSSAIESMIRSHLTAQMLATQEAAFFHGGGTNEANGIAGTAGIGSVVGGTNGLAPNYGHLVGLEEKVDAQNAMMGALAYATNGQIRQKLKLTPKQSSGVEGNFILSDLSPNTINGYRAAFTNAISRTLTKGTSSVASAIFFGNFADYVIGYWGGLNLELIRDSANAKLGLHTLVANTYYDGGVRRPKSFAAMLDALGA
jgi:HK97 family phage major capsid protein/HK97 family phage prohead protease